MSWGRLCGVPCNLFLCAVRLDDIELKNHDGRLRGLIFRLARVALRCVVIQEKRDRSWIRRDVDRLFDFLREHAPRALLSFWSFNHANIFPPAFYEFISASAFVKRAFDHRDGKRSSLFQSLGKLGIIFLIIVNRGFVHTERSGKLGIIISTFGEFGGVSDERRCELRFASAFATGSRVGLAGFRLFFMHR